MSRTSIPEHPLFPFEDDETAKEIAFIQVIRHEDGRSKQVPRMFRAEELRSLQDIFNLFGGGMYELWGRGRSISNPEAPGRIAANRRYEIAGLSKPLVDDGSNAPARSEPIAPSFIPAAVATQGAGNPDTSVMAMFMQMQMQMAQQSQEANRQMLTMMMTMLNTGKAESAQMMQMISAANAQQIQGMMGVIQAVVSKAGGGGGAEDMGKYIELFSKMGIVAKPGGDAPEPEGGGVGEIISNLADIVQGAVQLKEGGGLLGGAPPAPGSAAALMGVSPFKPTQGGGQGGAPAAP